MKALDAAIELFSNYEANIYLYHAFGAPKASGSMLISIDDILLKEAQANMKEELERVGENLPDGIKIYDKLVNNQLQNFVNEAVGSHSIDLIVMGTKGASGIQGTLFGSHTVNIMRKAEIPVLAVPLNSDANFTGDFKLVMGSDQKPFESVGKLNALLKYIKDAGGANDLKIVYVTPKPEEVRSEAKDFFSQNLPDVKIHFYNIIDSDVVSALNGFLREHMPDIFILVQRKNSLISRLMGDSVTQKISLDSPVPLMVIPD